MRNLISTTALSLITLNVSAFSMTGVQANIPQMTYQNNKGIGAIQNLLITIDGGLSQTISSQTPP